MQADRDLKKVLGIVLLGLSILVLVLGYLFQYGFTVSVTNLAQDFYANVSTDLASIAITILVIDYLSERRAERSFMQQLAREMGSKDNAFAVKAVKELRAHGWLLDGSLENIDLGACDLSKSDLSDASLKRVNLNAANLKEASLVRANLEGAIIKGANLESVDFESAILRDADISYSDMSNANLISASLNGVNFEGTALDGVKVNIAQLRSTKSLKQAIMPDGRKYEEWLKAGNI